METNGPLPIPAHPSWSVSAQGEIFYKGLPKLLKEREGYAPTLRFKENGVQYEFGLARLIAQLFIPNPQGYTRVVFKNGNRRHCTADNIAWASNSDFTGYSSKKNRPPKPQKPKAQRLRSPEAAKQSCTHPAAAEIPHLKGFYITPCAKLYQGNRPIEPHNKKDNKSLQVRIRYGGKVKYFGLAKLVATAFLPNPRCYDRIIFKDRNNKNCHLSNVTWASPAECNAYTGSFRTDRRPVLADKIEDEAVPIPGFTGYCITPNGRVYHGNRILQPVNCQGSRSPRIKLRTDAGMLTRVAIPKLIALAFVPNPNNYTKIIFKDRDKNNCTASNIEWVSLSQFASFVQSDRELDELLGPKKPKALPPVWTDPERVPIESFPGYYLTPNGTVYKGHKIIQPMNKKGATLKVRLRLKGWPQGKFMYLGLAKLLATHFIPNPRHHKHVIFKDRNNRNCVISNIAWVDGETFAFYSGISKGAKKIVLNREEAIRKCTDPLLKEYYKTLDESWLHDCWKGLEERVALPKWEFYKAECYIYFLDRAKRFSLLKDPIGLILAYTKGLREKLRQEIQPRYTRLPALENR